ncbi:hypothetical protein C8D89_1109 [Actinomycetospora cinnamomea]|uniref:Uncharacterized protein n=1 Tax=Actinomycetospora cinnamomea TaxID=663609 RepID=A0A2U1F6Q3_9PSEU|nr:hypothetical protein C8D89_1109 [Actinomycetospora cinnamomea]
MTIERSLWVQKLQELQAVSGKSFAHLAREAEKKKIAGLSKATVQRTISNGTLPRWKEAFLGLVKLLEVEDKEIDAFWEHVRKQENLRRRHQAQAVDDSQSLLEDTDPLMEPGEEDCVYVFEGDDTGDEVPVPARPEAQAIGIEYEDDWPYGADDTEIQERMIAWARAHRLRLEKDRVCVKWLQTGRCPHSAHLKREWTDHVTGWTRRGGRRSLFRSRMALTEGRSPSYSTSRALVSGSSSTAPAGMDTELLSSRSGATTRSGRCSRTGPLGPRGDPPSPGPVPRPAAHAGPQQPDLRPGERSPDSVAAGAPRSRWAAAWPTGRPVPTATLYGLIAPPAGPAGRALLRRVRPEAFRRPRHRPLGTRRPRRHLRRFLRRSGPSARGPRCR